MMPRWLPYALFILFAAPAVRGAEPARPNVLVILADDLGYSDIGCYGGEIATPNLDRLAQNGLRFTQFYNTARCWPTRGALLTGYYAQQIRRDAIPGTRGGGAQGTRPKWAKLLAERLRPLGYRTYHSGKWHVDGKPTDNGFDRSYQVDYHNNYFLNAKEGEGNPPEERVEEYVTAAIAQQAMDQLVEHGAEHADQPFFQYLCFTSPHFPLHALQRDIDRYRARYHEGWSAIQSQRAGRLRESGIATHPTPAMERELGPPHRFPNLLNLVGAGEVTLPLPWDELNDQQRAFQAAKMAIHAAMVDRMDQEIGRVVAQLAQMGALENTLILFLSDNGASAELLVRGGGHDQTAPPGSAATFLCLGPGWSSAANTPFRRHKTWVHEGGIATPFIAHWPRGIAARGELRRSPAHLIDLAPTILELAGAEGEFRATPDAPSAPGKSIVETFQADGPKSERELWWAHEGHRAIRVGDWKLVAAKGEPWELYDLSQDRGETRNLAADQPDKVAELKTLWNRRADEFRQHAASE